MTSFRLKQIGLALCLMASLLIGHASACTCSHPEETNTSDIDCHSHHESAENADIQESGDAIDDNCICVVEYPSPYAAASPVSRELRSNDPITTPEDIATAPEFLAVRMSGEPTPVFTRDLTVSNTLKALLPARAPPRL